MWIPSSSSLITLLAQKLLTPLSADPSVSHPMYPNHTLLTLNDGNVLPSPAFGVGSALYQKNATHDVLLALQTGYRHIDNAAIYANEESVGEAIRMGDVKREDLYITTKYDAIEGADVEEEFHASLKKLGVDYIDLYLIHFPEAAKNGGGLTKVWTKMAKLQHEGLIKSIGVSNFLVPDLTELLLIPNVPKPAVNQIRYHPYNALEMAPTLALCKLNGIIVEAYSSLSPITKFPDGPADKVGERIAHRISQVSGHLPVTYGQVILDWVKSKGIVAVTTSGKDYRQKEQLAVFSDGFPPLTDEEITALETAGPGWDKKQ